MVEVMGLSCGGTIVKPCSSLYKLICELSVRGVSLLSCVGEVCVCGVYCVCVCSTEYVCEFFVLLAFV